MGVSQGLDAAFCEAGQGEVSDSALQQVSAAVTEFVGALSRDELAACSLPRPEPLSPAQLAALAGVAAPAPRGVAADAASPGQAPGAAGIQDAPPSSQTAGEPPELGGKQSVATLQADDGEAGAEPPGPPVSVPVGLL